MFLASLFAYIFGNGVHYYNKNKNTQKRIQEACKMGMCMYCNGKKFYPDGGIEIIKNQ